jgi:choloylglycine hydrolase
LEFGIDPKSEAIVVPAGTAITGALPDGGKGISYVTKYGVVGANGFGQPVILDGINEVGLYVGLFYFPDTQATPILRRTAPLGRWGRTSMESGY